MFSFYKKRQHKDGSHYESFRDTHQRENVQKECTCSKRKRTKKPFDRTENLGFSAGHWSCVFRHTSKSPHQGGTCWVPLAKVFLFRVKENFGRFEVGVLWQNLFELWEPEKRAQTQKKGELQGAPAVGAEGWGPKARTHLATNFRGPHEKTLKKTEKDEIWGLAERSQEKGRSGEGWVQHRGLGGWEEGPAKRGPVLLSPFLFLLLFLFLFLLLLFFSFSCFFSLDRKRSRPKVVRA